MSNFYTLKLLALRRSKQFALWQQKRISALRASLATERSKLNSAVAKITSNGQQRAVSRCQSKINQWLDQMTFWRSHERIEALKAQLASFEQLAMSAKTESGGDKLTTAHKLAASPQSKARGKSTN